MKSILNKAECKRYALAQSKNLRNGRFTRVSQKFMDEMEAYLKQHICAVIYRAPTKGKTL